MWPIIIKLGIGPKFGQSMLTPFYKISTISILYIFCKIMMHKKDPQSERMGSTKKESKIQSGESEYVYSFRLLAMGIESP